MKFPILAECAVLAIVFVGCNLFDPSSGVSVKSGDTDMLIIEGQARFRDGDYAKAAEYFSAAIQNDSGKSEAWLGLSKANLYKNGGNPFKILREIDSDNSIPLMDMEISEANKLHNAVREALLPLRELIRRDTLTENNPSLKLSDRAVSYSNFSASYAILEYAYTVLRFRKSTDSDVKLGLRDDGSIEINADTLYEKALADPDRAMRFNAGMDTLQGDLRLLVGTILPELSDIVGDSVFLGSTAETVESSILYYRLGDAIDNDGDGCVDEEILDGKDNDGDGLIDEDLRLVPLDRESSPETLIGIGADSLDHDRDGLRENAPERTLRKDGLLLFAVEFKKISANDSAFQKIRRAIAEDTDSTNIRYPLSERKALVGRCWNNYTEEDFKAWFRNRGSAR